MAAAMVSVSINLYFTVAYRINLHIHRFGKITLYFTSSAARRTLQV
jgi:hypothetical protein